jgi:hypothetical protein
MPKKRPWRFSDKDNLTAAIAQVESGLQKMSHQLYAHYHMRIITVDGSLVGSLPRGSVHVSGISQLGLRCLSRSRATFSDTDFFSNTRTCPGP